MRPIVIIMAVVLTSCGGRDTTLNYGQTTRADIISYKGRAPDREHTVPVKDNSILIFGEESFQLEKDVLTTLIRSPSGDEVSLIYWQNRFKNCSPKEEVLGDHNLSDVEPEAQLSCGELGESVIYTKGSGMVRRIMVYAKK